MSSPLQRLYKTKLALLATVSTGVGVALLFLARWADTQAGWVWLKALPVQDVGLLLFGTGLFGVIYQYVGQRDAEENFLQQLRHVLHDAAPDFRDAVVSGFAFEPDSLTNVASPATLDRVVENCLAIRLHDKALAKEVYTDLREQVVRAKERWYDLQISAALSPWSDGPPSTTNRFFVATIRYEYRTKLSGRVMRFASVSDLDEYRELLQDPATTKVWYFEPIAGLDATSADAFELVGFTVNGRPRPVRRTKRAGSQTYTVALDAEARADDDGTVTIAYTYRGLVQRHGHVLHLDISCPVKGLKTHLAYGNCGIRHVNVLDYITSAQQPRVEQRPASDPTPSIEVGFDGWVFPKAGVAFVWVLDEEMAVARKQPSSRV